MSLLIWQFIKENIFILSEKNLIFVVDYCIYYNLS
jgi:hypothetical protein